MVNQRDIEANPKKVKTLIEMRSPQKLKEMQSLAGHVAALSASSQSQRTIVFSYLKF